MTVNGTGVAAARPAAAVVHVGAVGERRRGVLTGIFALLTLHGARTRVKRLRRWVFRRYWSVRRAGPALEVGRRYINDALNRTTGDIRQVADVMVDHAEGSLHQWLNLTLAAGGVLVVFGVIVSMLGGLRRN